MCRAIFNCIRKADCIAHTSRGTLSVQDLKNLIVITTNTCKAYLKNRKQKIIALQNIYQSLTYSFHDLEELVHLLWNTCLVKFCFDHNFQFLASVSSSHLTTGHLIAAFKPRTANEDLTKQLMFFKLILSFLKYWNTSLHFSSQVMSEFSFHSFNFSARLIFAHENCPTILLQPE